MSHRDHLGITISIVLLGLILAFLIPLPEWRFVFSSFGADIELYFSALSQLTALVAGLSCMGTDVVMRDHPRVQGRSLAYTLTFWPLPGALVALSLALLFRMRWWSSRFILVALTGLALALVILLERYGIETETGIRDLSHLLLNVVVYIVALLAFSALYGAHVQGVLAAAGAFLVGTALALRPLRQEQRLARVWLYAALTGLIMGELMLPLVYCSLSPSVGGAFLFLVFYSVTTLAQRELSDGLQRQDVVEIVAVFCLGLVLLMGRARGIL
ncbi:MAG: hypothetical protein ACLFV5_10470 [Anaerolineales bacterium]